MLDIVQVPLAALNPSWYVNCTVPAEPEVPRNVVTIAPLGFITLTVTVAPFNDTPFEASLTVTVIATDELRE